MGSFKWLHLSDLHFRVYEGFNMSLILDRLREQLKQQTQEGKFRYIFLTGDLADQADYTMVEERIRDLLLDSQILETGGSIFWVCGNHDLPRTSRLRRREIEDIRNKDEADITFEQEFLYEDNRQVILGAFKEYYTYRDRLFGMKGQDYPHQVVHTDDVEIVLLNTCLTSCDNEDEHKLYLIEPNLIHLFREIEPGKPVFVLGHHSASFLADEDKSRLLNLFRDRNVSLYLCGHSHQLGIQPLSESIQEVVSGGFKKDGFAVVSFFIGYYDEKRQEYSLIPYTCRPGSGVWAVDYSSVPGMTEGRTYPVSLPALGSTDELDDLVIRSRNLFRELQKSPVLESLGVEKLNQLGMRALQKYVQTLPDAGNTAQMDFAFLCEEAIQKGNKAINYTSLRLTESRRDIWRFRNNLTRILHELGKNDTVFPALGELLLDFNELYEAVNWFDVTENTYVLVTDGLHDIELGRKKLLADFPWDVILDYDGHSGTGGLRGCTSRQNIKDWGNDYQVVREAILRRGITSWIQMGEEMQFSLDPTRGISLRTMKNLFRELVGKLYQNASGSVIFVFLKDIEVWDKELMQIVWDRFEEKARFVLAGAYPPQRVELELCGLFLDSEGKQVRDSYRVFSTSTTQFMDKYSEYSDNFLEKKKYEQRLFPSNSRLEKMDPNLYVNLEDFFEVLTSDIGTDLTHHEEELEQFYLGGEATWGLFYRNDIMELLAHEVMEDLVGRIRKALTAKQEKNRDAIFYLLHDAGFGGTTTAKLIAWKMHKEHPTLILKDYEYGKIRPLIQTLYDMHTRKGILVIADESRFSTGDLENLEQEMGTADRAFALLIVKRLKGKAGTGSRNTKKLNSISRDVVEALKSCFKEHSHLDQAVLDEKDEHFDNVFTKNSGMRCPFLIGLYYQDKLFNGVSGYVKRIVENIDSEQELQLLLALAVVNYYGRTGMIKELVKSYVPLASHDDYLERYPYAKEAFIRSNDGGMGMRLYREKHPLISQELMEQCARKLYGSGLQENLKTVSEELIRKILKINKEGITLYYKNLLERMFVYKNAIDVDENGYTSVEDFSPMILALPSQASKEEVMCGLAEQVEQVVGQLSADGNILYFKMAAHICGHLARLYNSAPASLKQMENSRKSEEWCEHAETIMRRSGFEDAYIYHMYGTSLSKQCQDKLNMWKSEMESCSDKEASELENLVKRALKKFDQAVSAGEVVRGYVSKLSLLMEYMRFLLKWKKIGSVSELHRLSEEERRYIKDIEDLIDFLEETELDDRDTKRLMNLRNDYRAEIMYSNYGKAIEYYTNSIRNVIQAKGEDAEELYVLRSGLAGAVLGKYWQEQKDPYQEMEERDITRILDALEKNIFSTVVLADRWEQQRRCNDCYRWLRVAKLSSTAVQTGLKVAERWRDLQKVINIRDPRPYYYLAVLHYLNALDGYKESLELARVNHHEAYRIASSNSSFRIVKIEKIRDILLEGKGMGRLRSVVDLSTILERYSPKLIKLKGKFHKIENAKNPKVGNIRVTYPQELRETNVSFRMGEQNTITSNQETHLLEFGVGFTFERMEALNNTVKDITRREE